MHPSLMDKMRLTLDLNRAVVQQLRQACETEADISAYLEHIVLSRSIAWRRSVRALEDAGWTSDEVQAVRDALTGEPFADFFNAHDLAAELRWVGLRRLSRRVARSAEAARAIVCVVAELRAQNAACDRAIRLMRPPRRRWWRG
jgi:hypothetical protein